jgi:hypothetical protein
MPRGGARPGAGRPRTRPLPDPTAEPRERGRPAGSKNVLPHGTVSTLNAARIAERRLETRKDATEEDRRIVTRVYERVGEVLEGRVLPAKAFAVLKAGAMVADAVAGPQAQKLEIKDESQHSRLAFSVADRVLGAPAALDRPAPAAEQEVDVSPAAVGGVR